MGLRVGNESKREKGYSGWRTGVRGSPEQVSGDRAGGGQDWIRVSEKAHPVPCVSGQGAELKIHK